MEVHQVIHDTQIFQVYMQKYGLTNTHGGTQSVHKDNTCPHLELRKDKIRSEFPDYMNE